MILESVVENGGCSSDDSISKMGSADAATKKLLPENGCAVQPPQNDVPEEEYGQNLKILPTNDQVKELQTILRDK